MTGRRFSRLRKKHSEFIQLDDVTVNWKLEGNRLSRIIPVSRYKTSEVFQLPSLLTMWGLLVKRMLKDRVGESNIEEWSKHVLNEMRRVFVIGGLKEKGLYRKT